MVDEIDLSELLRAVEEVQEIYRTPLPRPLSAWPVQRHGGEYVDARADAAIRAATAWRFVDP